MRTLSPEWRKVVIGSWIMIAMLAVATLVLYVDNKRTRDCFADYMAKDQNNTIERAKIADAERLAFLQTLTVVFDARSTPQGRQKAGEDYIKLVEQNNLLRKENPILPVPTSCK